eukprot:Gregarina_sp_Pseudo_9__1990@NODE_237_length_3467_cov_21_119312_g221_i0_p1_GENE_NODE_237_length_3467_cov_21_119312_g221_i0NODE_237_length_3467_cov_21_119312_g221_i0_p1_ORF_typecomplete_len708_score64_00CLASP_N/PF12348_8/1_8e17_NODE_237_length_3467_cov_21_119312_g221_i013423438
MNSPSNRVDMGGMDYPSWESLEEPNSTHFAEPGVLLTTLTRSLECVDDWKTQYEGLTELQRIAKHNPTVLLSKIASVPSGEVSLHPTTCLVEKISDLILPCVNSLRSALSKNAMLTIIAFIKGLGGDYLDCLSAPHGSRNSPLRASRIPPQYPRLASLMNVLLQKASSTAEKKFIQSAAEDTLALLAAQPKGAEPLLCVILKIMKESKNSRMVGACGQVALKCWHSVSNEWVSGAEADSIETVVPLVSQCIPLLLNDKNPASRAAAKKLTDEMRVCATNIDQQPLLLLPLPDSTNMSQYLHSVWGNVNANITSPSMRMSMAKLLGLNSANFGKLGSCTLTSNTRHESVKSATNDAASVLLTRSPLQQRRQASAAAHVRSPERNGTSSRLLPKAMAHGSAQSKLRQLSQVHAVSSTRRNLAKTLTSGANASPDRAAPRSHTLRSLSSQPSTYSRLQHCANRTLAPHATFAMPTRSSYVTLPHQPVQAALQQRQRSVSQRTRVFPASEITRCVTGLRPCATDLSRAERGRPNTATVPAIPTRGMPAQLPRGRKAPDDMFRLGHLKAESLAALPPRSKYDCPQRPPLLHGRPVTVPSLSCSYQEYPIVSGESSTYGRGSSGGLMEKSLTTVSTATSSHEDRAHACISNHSARERSRSLSNRLRILSSRRSMSVNGRSMAASLVAAGPQQLPAWLDDDSTEG